MTVQRDAVSRVPLVDLSGAFGPGPRRGGVVDAIRRACEDVGLGTTTVTGASGISVLRTMPPQRGGSRFAVSRPQARVQRGRRLRLSHADAAAGSIRSRARLA